MLKKALENSNPQFYEKYYSALHTLKPFTFSIYFPELSGQEGKHFNVGHKAFLNFSTSSYEFGTYLYNGLLTLRRFPLFSNALMLSDIELRRITAVTKDIVIFKTLSPFLINSKGNPNWYLLPGQDGFEEGLNFAVREIARTFLKTEDASIDFKPINIKRKVVRHYNMDMQGGVGIFELRGQPELLNLIYQIGLGVRRSQGFGMLEIVR
ncbi:MAG TPA: CRISPR-associated endoribonuclease Cas6 [Pyrinomonadaceae bacterium]